MKEFTFEYHPEKEEKNRPILAIAANDNQPGNSASFSLSCESSAGWSFELNTDNVRSLGVKSFGVAGPDEHHGAMGRPSHRDPPKNWTSNDFDDSNWDHPTKATCMHWPNHWKMGGLWHKSDKYSFYRIRMPAQSAIKGLIAEEILDTDL